jgi:NodT family efflux transporter outer membrane factor (OMF) lipoprotein
MRIFTNYILLVSVTLLLFMAGCMVGPDYVRPDMELPDHWSGVEGSKEVNGEQLRQWWTAFDDTTLLSLLERADEGSPTLEAAVARVEQSRALRAYAAGEKVPNVDAVADYTRSRYSANTLSAIPGEHDLYSAGFDASWEIDLFGRVRRSVESAQARLEQSFEDYRDTRLVLYAELARNYIELRTLQARLDYARTNIEIQQKTLELTQNRFDVDLVPALDVSQARLNLSNSESEIPVLRIAEARAINRLAVLTGLTPGALRDELLVSAPLMDLSRIPAGGQPAELLRRRPDIRSAERALAAQTARIGLAEAQRYPSFSLSGTFELQAVNTNSMNDWSSRAFGFGPALRWNIFDGNRLKSLVAVEQARTRELAAAYESAVLRAVEDVENALVSFEQQRYRTESLKLSVEAARDSLEKVETLYRNGLTDFQNVLDVQRSLSLQQDRLAVSEGAALQQAVAIYKALGGGWDADISQNEEVENN